MYLHTIDYTAHQRNFDMDILTNSNNVSVRNFAENAAIEQIKTYLRRRYDVALIFIVVRDWDVAATYNEGDHVVKSGAMYYALDASTGQDPVTEDDYWQLGDLRDPFLVMTSIDMAVYHLYAKIPKRNAPEDVSLRYGDAIKWLEGVSKGNFIPNFPLLSVDPDSENNEIKFGSATKLNHRW